MSKFGIFALVALLAGAVSAQQKYDQIKVSNSNANGAATTNSVGIRGEIKTIYVDVPATKTGTVTITSAEGFTVLSTGSITADTVYKPQIQVYTTAGAAATNGASGYYGDITAVGNLTVITDDNSAGTNTWTVYINYLR